MTAASPRRATSSRIAAVAASTLGSCALSKASSFASSPSKPVCAVESLRTSAMGRLRKGLDERGERLALELHGGGIHDEPARDGHDLLDHAQPVGPKRVAGIDQ